MFCSDDLSMRMGRPMRPSQMPGILVLNQPGMPSSYASPTRPELVSNRPIWDPNRPALRLIPPEPPAPKSFVSPIISSNWLRLPCGEFFCLGNVQKVCPRDINIFQAPPTPGHKKSQKYKKKKEPTHPNKKKTKY